MARKNWTAERHLEVGRRLKAIRQEMFDIVVTLNDCTIKAVQRLARRSCELLDRTQCQIDMNVHSVDEPGDRTGSGEELDSQTPGWSENTTTMPFGQYRGKDLTTVPTFYLQWVLKECSLSSGLRAGLSAEIERRECQRCGPAGKSVT